MVRTNLARIDDENEARKQPELAVLSAAARAHEPDSVDSVAAALSACECLDNERATLYAELIFARLGEASVGALETLMELRKHQYQSEFAKKYFAQGREEKRRAFLSRLLSQRFGELPKEVQERIAKADMTTLEQWSERVLVAKSVTDIFADG
ncbi:MAG: DUF4351 domain-containing protein [Proteobacteria bacterium]|nr:DUF4351 domain-containing protein [Pseudomonadota bacterium]